jgi:hypothetical protein
MLRESAFRGRVSGVEGSRFGCVGMRAGLDRMLDDAAKGHFHGGAGGVAGSVGQVGVAWIEATCRWSGLRSRSCGSMATHRWREELIDDFMALLASFSGRFYQLRSRLNQRRLLGRCGSTVCGGNSMKTVDTQKAPGSCGSTTTRWSPSTTSCSARRKTSSRELQRKIRSCGWSE